MDRRRALALVAFAWMMIGAHGRGCDPWAGWSNPPPPAQAPAPAKPFCNADPPVGCAAVCAAVDDVELTAACADIGANTRADQFAKDVQMAIDALHAQGMNACDAAHVGVASVTPCQDGLPPLEWPNQDHETCTPPPAGCIVGGP